jgi:hypothetical protein
MAGKMISAPFDAITHRIIGYLAVSCYPFGLLINFGERSLRHRRVFTPQKVIDHLVNRQ